MQTIVRESWTDERLDDLNKRVDDGFAKVDQRFDKLEGRLETMQKEMNQRFESLHRTMVFAAVALSSAYIAGFATLITQV